MTFERFLALSLTLGLVSFTACGDDALEPGDSGTDSAAGDSAVADTGVDADVPANNSLTIADQTLDLSTVVTAGSVSVTAAGYLVIHADDSGSLGDVLGVTPVSAGTATDVEVAFSEPLDNGTTTLHGVLYGETNSNTTFDLGTDTQLTDGASAAIDEMFTATVAAGTPAVRITIRAENTLNYLFLSVAPTAFSDILTPTDTTTPVDDRRDPSLTLQQDWRYQIVNESVGQHPLGLLDNFEGGNSSDVTLLSQQSTDPASELETNDSAIDWQEEVDGSTGTITFTVSPSLVAAGLDGYRCEVHVQSMRGAISIVTPSR